MQKSYHINVLVMFENSFEVSLSYHLKFWACNNVSSRVTLFPPAVTDIWPMHVAIIGSVASRWCSLSALSAQLVYCNHNRTHCTLCLEYFTYQRLCWLQVCWKNSKQILTCKCTSLPWILCNSTGYSVAIFPGLGTHTGTFSLLGECSSVTFEDSSFASIASALSVSIPPGTSYWWLGRYCYDEMFAWLLHVCRQHMLCHVAKYDLHEIFCMITFDKVWCLKLRIFNIFPDCIINLDQLLCTSEISRVDIGCDPGLVLMCCFYGRLIL